MNVVRKVSNSSRTLIEPDGNLVMLCKQVSRLSVPQPVPIDVDVMIIAWQDPCFIPLDRAGRGVNLGGVLFNSFADHRHNTVYSPPSPF